MQHDKRSKLSRRWFARPMHRVIAAAAVLATFVTIVVQPAHAEDKEVTIAYQQIVDPWVVAIANGSIEKETGY